MESLIHYTATINDVKIGRLHILPNGSPCHCDDCLDTYFDIKQYTRKALPDKHLESLSYGLESLAGMFRSVGKALESQ